MGHVALKGIIATLIKPANLIALEAFISDVHPTSAKCSDGRKFLDREADSLRRSGEPTITCWRAPRTNTLAFGYKQLGR